MILDGQVAAHLCCSLSWQSTGRHRYCQLDAFCLACRAVSSRTGGARHESSAAYAASAASRAEAARIAARVQKQATMPTPKAAVYAEGAYFPC